MKTFFVLIAMIFVLLPSTTFAKQMEYSATGTYRMGDDDSINAAKEQAKKDAVKKILSESGVIVSSQTKVENAQVTEDKIQVDTAQFLKIKRCDFEFDKDKMEMHAFVIATVDDKVYQKKMEEFFNGSNSSTQKNPDEKKTKISRENEYTLDIFRSTDQIENHDFTTAALNLSTIISSQKNSTPAKIYYLRSVARFGLGQYNEALSDIKKAIHADGKNPLYYVQEAFIRLAVSQLYLKWNQPGQAKQEYMLAEQKCNTAISFKSHYWPALHCRAIVQYLNDNIRKSVNDADTARSHGGKGIGYVEEFSDYINARYKTRHQYVVADPIQPMLMSSVIGLIKDTDKKKK